MLRDSDLERVADLLARLYAKKFGGKNSGRYRIATKLVRSALGRRRLYEDDIRELTREMFERGYLLIDMDGFFAVMSINSFVNYRRANDECIKAMA